MPVACHDCIRPCTCGWLRLTRGFEGAVAIDSITISNSGLVMRLSLQQNWDRHHGFSNIPSGMNFNLNVNCGETLKMDCINIVTFVLLSDGVYTHRSILVAYIAAPFSPAVLFMNAILDCGDIHVGTTILYIHRRLAYWSESDSIPSSWLGLRRTVLCWLHIE